MEPIYNETDMLLNKIGRFLLVGRLSAKAILALTKEELMDYFHAGKIPGQRRLDNRFGGYALLYDKTGKATFFEGNKFKEMMTAIVAHIGNQEIKGTTAYPGKVTGLVRVVLDPARVKVFNEGDILIAGMTRPEYLNLMKKSGAFVTDAGGLLCHAAIVAREYRKPCVIGTEAATKVFKDGDLVEVDANKGIVRRV